LDSATEPAYFQAGKAVEGETKSPKFAELPGAAGCFPPVAIPSKRVYEGCTRLSFDVFDRHPGQADSEDSCGFARLVATGDDK
jgi:hypothetical protein